MITKKLKQLVINEATNLKKYTSAEERARLNFDTFDSGDPHHCIYGQMTGDCRSSRSLELLNNCTTPYSGAVAQYNTEVGEYFEGYFRGFSPVEFYIFKPQAKNKTLINFLKGETETLTIEEL